MVRESENGSPGVLASWNASVGLRPDPIGWDSVWAERKSRRSFRGNGGFFIGFFVPLRQGQANEKGGKQKGKDSESVKVILEVFMCSKNRSKKSEV